MASFNSEKSFALVLPHEIDIVYRLEGYCLSKLKSAESAPIILLKQAKKKSCLILWDYFY